MFQVACCFSLRSNLALASPRLCFQVALIKLLWLAALFLHESGQCGHIGEAVAQFLAFAVELEAEVFLHGQAEFECVYGIEAEAAVAEQGFFVADVGGREVFQAEAVDNQLFDFLFQVSHVFGFFR